MTRLPATLAALLAGAALGLAAAPAATAQGTTPQTCDRSFDVPGTDPNFQPGTDPNFHPGGTDPSFGAGGDGDTYGPEWSSGVPCSDPGTPDRTAPDGPLEDVTGVLGRLFG